MIYDYRILTAREAVLLRRERVKTLEADLCRARISREDALSTEEQAAHDLDINDFSRRLSIQYEALERDEEGGAGQPTP